MAHYQNPWDWGLSVESHPGVLALDDALWLMRRGFSLWLEFRTSKFNSSFTIPVGLVRYTNEIVDLTGQWVRPVDEYDKTWRLWNRRPTEKRMKEEEWL